MELADDISYAAHDLEDSLRAGLISMDDIGAVAALDSIVTMHESIEQRFKTRRRLGGEARRKVVHRELAARLITMLIESVALERIPREEQDRRGGASANRLTLSEHAEVARTLKNFIFEMIVRHHDVSLIEAKGRKIISGLFECLLDETFNVENHLLPLEFQDRLENPDIFFPELTQDQALVRCIGDYVSGMTDIFAERAYKELRGVRGDLSL